MRDGEYQGTKHRLYETVFQLISYNYTIHVMTTPSEVKIAPEHVLVALRYYSEVFLPQRIRRGFLLIPLPKMLQLLDSPQLQDMLNTCRHYLMLEKKASEKKYEKLTRTSTFDI